MSRKAVAENLRKLADSIESLIEEEPVKAANKKISFENLRGFLAELARDGKQKEVKELITSYGAKKLSEIPEEKYQKLLEKAEKL